MCGNCCLVSSYALGDSGYRFPVSVLVATVLITAVCVFLLIKLVSGFRKVSKSVNLRGEKSVVVGSFYFRYLVLAIVVLLLEAFSFFLSVAVSWGVYINLFTFCLRSSVVFAPIVFMSIDGRRHVWLKVIGVSFVVFAIQAAMLFPDPPSQGTDLVGVCLVCEHFLPRSLPLFVAFCVAIVVFIVMLVFPGKKLTPRISARAYLVFLTVSYGAGALGLGLAIFGPSADVADSGICFALLAVPIFCVGFGLACYYSFSADSKILWKLERSGQSNSLLAEFWRHSDVMQSINNNESIAIIDEPDLEISEKVLGRGGYAQVLAGKWKAQRVAVKAVYALHDDNAMQVLGHEVNMLGLLRHPNVVLLLGVCPQLNQDKSGFSLLMVFEYCDGGTLFDKIHRHEIGLNDEDAYNHLLEICRGMAYLHSRNFIHRDLKSANVLLSQNAAKICDFGLSRILNDTLATMTTVGTPAWTAPEVLRGEKYSIYADVYSFGVIVWEVTMKAVPFSGMTPLQIVGNALNDNMKRLEIPLDCNPTLREIMQKTLDEKNANERLTFVQLIEELEKSN